MTSPERSVESAVDPAAAAESPDGRIPRAPDDDATGPTANTTGPGGTPPSTDQEAARLSGVAPGAEFSDPSLGPEPTIVAPSEYVAPGRSALAHWKVVSVLTIIGLLVGGLIGYERHPIYTATSTLYVGKTLSLSNTASINGLALAATSIAEDYARLMPTATVVRGAERVLHESSLGATLSATVVPQTPEISVYAKGPSPATVVRVANAGAQALVNVVAALNASSAASLSNLRNEYASIEVQINSASSVEGSLKYDLAHGIGNAAIAKSRIASLESTISKETLQAQTIEAQYQNQDAPYGSESRVLQVESAAANATSDRKTATEIGGVGGLVGGFLVGVLVASAIDVRHGRRRRRSVQPA